MPPPIPYAPRNAQFVCDPADFDKAIKPNSDGSINVWWLPGPAAGVTVTDNSFTTTGSDATVIAANTSRVGFLIENPVSASLNANGASIFVNLGAAGTANGDSFEVTPGGYFPPPWLPLYLGAIHVIGATGIKVTAKEMTA